MESCKKRQKASEYALKWRAKKSGKTFVVTLSKAADDEQCSISCENINEAKLEWMNELNETGFIRRESDLRKATLECGHSFAVLPLAYHFVKNNMRCPVCRAGDENPMTVSSVPIHLRKAVASHAESCRKQEAAEQAREEHNESVATIQRILASNLIHAYVPFADSNFPSTVNMHIGIFTENNFSFYDFRITVSLRHCIGSEGVYVLPRCHFRDLCRHLRSCEATAVCMEVAWEEFDLCSSPMLHLPILGGNLGGNEPGPNPYNVERQTAVNEYSTAMHTLDAQTGALQESKLVFEHPILDPGHCDSYMPYSTVRWVPSIPEVQFVIQREATRFAESYVSGFAP